MDYWLVRDDDGYKAWTGVVWAYVQSTLPDNALFLTSGVNEIPQSFDGVGTNAYLLRYTV